jgi:acetyltransferase-like isoleucine patch superfamily enzyme
MIKFILGNIYNKAERKIRPIFYFFFAILRIKRWSDYFSTIENTTNRPIPSITKTLYFNIRCLPYRQAKVLPIFVYSHTRFQNLSGKIEIDGNISTGMIKLGRDWGYRCKGETRIRIEGCLLFHGKCEILRGSDICIFANGMISLGDDVLISENVLIYCMDKIFIGNMARIAYETNIFDSDFHYTVDIEKREIKKKTSPIVIGNNVWIGNRTNIKKGVIIPDYTIVAASGSLLTKDYTNIVPMFGCLGGYPARPLPVRSCRTWRNEHERIKFLNTWFDKHPDSNIYKIPEEDNLEDYTGITIDTYAGQ